MHGQKVPQAGLEPGAKLVCRICKHVEIDHGDRFEQLKFASLGWAAAPSLKLANGLARPSKVSEADWMLLISTAGLDNGRGKQGTESQDRSCMCENIAVS